MLPMFFLVKTKTVPAADDLSKGYRICRRPVKQLAVVSFMLLSVFIVGRFILFPFKLCLWVYMFVGFCVCALGVFCLCVAFADACVRLCGHVVVWLCVNV